MPDQQQAAGTVKITVTDPATGKVIEERLLNNDYCVLVAGNRYVDAVRVMGRPGRATHIVTIKVAGPQEQADG